MGSRGKSTRRFWRFRADAAQSAAMRLEEQNAWQWITTIRASKDTTRERAASCACEGFYAGSATHSSDVCVITRKHSIEAGSIYDALHGR
jgi:hypothetical protein